MAGWVMAERRAWNVRQSSRPISHWHSRADRTAAGAELAGRQAGRQAGSIPHDAGYSAVLYSTVIASLPPYLAACLHHTQKLDSNTGLYLVDSQFETDRLFRPKALPTVLTVTDWDCDCDLAGWRGLCFASQCTQARVQVESQSLLVLLLLFAAAAAVSVRALSVM